MCNCGRGRQVPAPSVVRQPTLTVSDAPVPASAPAPVTVSQRRFGARRPPIPRALPEIPAPLEIPTPPEIVPENADTSVWGANLWTVLHIASEFSGTSKHIPLWRAIPGAMRTGIPCQECRDHFRNWHNKNPLKFNAMFGGFHHNAIHLAIVRWVVNIHNHANKNSGSSE